MPDLRWKRFPGFSSFPRAASDSKPWSSGGSLAVCRHCGAIQKIPDAKWLEETRIIYSDYQIYHQSAGAEQLIFTEAGDAQPRSRQLIERVCKLIDLPKQGKALDIGCGDGATLRSFSQLLPEWKLYGSELSASTLDSLKTIKNFVNLYTIDPNTIADRFSLVSIVHTLEHIQDPGRTLQNAVKLLEPNGVLVVEVPAIEASPFDLLVADHIMHFSVSTLRRLAVGSGLNVLSLDRVVSPKEITLIATAGRNVGGVGESDPAEGVRIVKSNVSWLEQVFAAARAASAKGQLAIFGTAIAGMALYEMLRDHVPFFVDEDPSRIGRYFDGKPVLAPADVPSHVPVFIALIPERAQPVAERCRQLGLHCILPPPLDSLS